MPASIVVAGSLNMDFVARVESLPLPGETVLGAGFRTIPEVRVPIRRARPAVWADVCG